MGLNIVGGVSGDKADVGSLWKGLKIEVVPNDVGNLGEYAVDFISGSISAGLGGASTVFAFRWTDSSRMALIRRIRTQIRATTGFTQGSIFLEAVVARAWTVADTSGTVVTPTGDTGKLKQSMGTTLVNEVRISNTGALSAGTRTLDALPFATLSADSGAAVKPSILPPYDLWDCGNRWPQVLGQNEGFIIRATVPATGVWLLSVAVNWAEVPSF